LSNPKFSLKFPKFFPKVAFKTFILPKDRFYNVQKKYCIFAASLVEAARTFVSPRLHKAATTLGDTLRKRQHETLSE
jgi:hypothetical protein